MMTKDQLQKELKEKVKAGIKPSDIRKLKRSKSADDIPLAPPSPIKNLEDQISVLTLTIEIKDRELAVLVAENKELKKNPPNLLLTDQLKQKQSQIEQLTKQLESQNSQLTETTHQLDTSLQARYTSLQAWWTQYSQNKALDAELTENIEQAATELINQDKELVDLRSQVQKLKLEKQNLVRDLNLSQRVNELRKYPLPNPENLDYLKYALYCLLTVWFISLLNSSWKLNRNYE